MNEETTSIAIKVNYEGQHPTVSGRELHKALEIETPYHKWFPRMCEYGFTENEDYITEDKIVHRADGSIMPQTQHDHTLTIPMAKELCMLQRNEKGKIFRQYFIKVEEAWNSPEMVMKRALEFADRKIKDLQQQIISFEPKVLFANAVETAKTSILIGDLAKLLKQNGIEIGQNRLFEWLRGNNYLISRGDSKNMPTQRAMEAGLFEIKERTSISSDGSIHITKTTKVTGKGQVFFVNKFLKRKPAIEG